MHADTHTQETLTSARHGCGDVLGEDGDALGVDGVEVGVLEETNKVGLRSPCRAMMAEELEAEVQLEVLGNLAHTALEGQLEEEELGRLLVAADLAEGDGAGPVPVGFLDTTSGGGGLAGCLGGECLAGALPPVDS